MHRTRQRQKEGIEWPNHVQVVDTRRHGTPAPPVLPARVLVVKPAVGAHELGILGPQTGSEHPLVAIPLDQLGLQKTLNPDFPATSGEKKKKKKASQRRPPQKTKEDPTDNGT